MQFGIDYDIGWAGFTNTGGAIADAIGYGERWERAGLSCPTVTHAFLVTGERTGIEAHLETGVARFDLNKYAGDSNCKLYFRKPRGWTPDIGARIVARAAIHPPFGCSYDTNLIFADGLNDTFLGQALNKLSAGQFKRLICWLMGSEQRFICSETVAFVYQQLPELAKRGCLVNPANTIDPQQLFDDEVLFEGPVINASMNVALGRLRV